MQNYLSRINKIKKRLNIPEKEIFVASHDGTHYKVFLSKKYVIRFRDDSPKLLLREAKFLQNLDHPLIPKTLWAGKINRLFAMVENRVPGKTINLVWKNLTTANKINITKQVIEFLEYQKTQTKGHIYSVSTGKIYKDSWDYLMDGIDKKIAIIKKNKRANNLIIDLLLIINKLKNKRLFINKTNIALVHGDLIIHNLVTDGKNLTGVLDWELASFGDPDYDLFRLFYYRECARAYQEQGLDKTFEADYMDRLTKTILKSNLIKNRHLFQKKYQIVRAIFYINALYWAVNADNKKNINEIINLWNKVPRSQATVN